MPAFRPDSVFALLQPLCRAQFFFFKPPPKLYLVLMVPLHHVPPTLCHKTKNPPPSPPFFQRISSLPQLQRAFCLLDECQLWCYLRFCNDIWAIVLLRHWLQPEIFFFTSWSTLSTPQLLPPVSFLGSGATENIPLPPPLIFFFLCDFQKIEFSYPFPVTKHNPRDRWNHSLLRPLVPVSFFPPPSFPKIPF